MHNFADANKCKVHWAICDGGHDDVAGQRDEFQIMAHLASFQCVFILDLMHRNRAAIAIGSQIRCAPLWLVYDDECAFQTGKHLGLC